MYMFPLALLSSEFKADRSSNGLPRSSEKPNAYELFLPFCALVPLVEWLSVDQNYAYQLEQLANRYPSTFAAATSMFFFWPRPLALSVNVNRRIQISKRLEPLYQVVIIYPK